MEEQNAGISNSHNAACSDTKRVDALHLMNGSSEQSDGCELLRSSMRIILVISFSSSSSSSSSCNIIELVVVLSTLRQLESSRLMQPR